MKRTILHTSSEVTRFANTANVLSKLLEVKVPEGTSYILENPTRFFQKLFSAANTQIPGTSEIFFAARAPGMDWPTFMVKNVYSAFFDLTTTQQRNAENVEPTTLSLGNLPRLVLREDYVFEVWIKSPAVVDFNVAGTTFEFDVDQQN